MPDDAHLSQISTLWSVIRRAHADESAEARTAQQEMIDRYGGAIKRYLLGAFRNEVAAEDAFQEFALRFVNGDYRSLDPDKGRFRSFLKTVLYRLVVEHHRDKKRHNRPQMASDFPEPADLDSPESDAMFEKSWRAELLKRAWNGLQRLEEQTGKPMCTVMRARVDGPDLSSSELANMLTKKLDKKVTAANVRVMLHRARDEFSKLLLKEVANTLDQPSRANIESELMEVGLLEYCRPAFDKLNSERRE
jgi:RNA polymerase sigma-70 factor (ECF subfamily)